MSRMNTTIPLHTTGPNGSVQFRGRKAGTMKCIYCDGKLIVSNKGKPYEERICDRCHVMWSDFGTIWTLIDRRWKWLQPGPLLVKCESEVL